MLSFFWLLASCQIVGRCQSFRETYWLYFQAWRWRQYDPSKQWHLPTILHGSKIQEEDKTTASKFCAVFTLHSVNTPDKNPRNLKTSSKQQLKYMASSSTWRIWKRHGSLVRTHIFLSGVFNNSRFSTFKHAANVIWKYIKPTSFYSDI